VRYEVLTEVTIKISVCEAMHFVSEESTASIFGADSCTLKMEEACSSLLCNTRRNNINNNNLNTLKQFPSDFLAILVSLALTISNNYSQNINRLVFIAETSYTRPAVREKINFHTCIFGQVRASSSE
jgi:hypothetical protein